MACTCTINRGFIYSILGGLQLGVTSLGLLTVCMLGAAMSISAPDSNAYFMISGFSFYGFLFLVSFWCFMSSAILIITCATSANTAALLVKTTFYLGYHGAAALFYLFGSLALLVEAAKFQNVWVSFNGKSSGNLKALVYASGCIGCVECILYVLITIVGVVKFRHTDI